MYLLDANILLEVLYKRSRWRECFKLLNRVKRGEIQAYMLHFTLHGVSAILGEPRLVSSLLSELASWQGLTIVDLSLEEELLAADLADKVGLDFDDGLQYYFAKKRRIPIVSYDKDFDDTDIERVEPSQLLHSH